MSQLAQKLIAENKATKSPFLDLGNCGLTELPNELLDCYWLENLNLGRSYFSKEKQEFKGSKNKEKPNQITSLTFKKSTFDIFSKPKDISELQNLRILTVNGEITRFRKPDISDISMLKNLVHLTVLSFGSNSVLDISPLQHLQNLQNLYFSKNLVSDISALANLQNLQTLNFYNNSVSDISPLQHLQNLQNLYFNDNLVLDISSLANLNNLQRLRFTNTPAFKKLPQNIREKYSNDWDNQIEILPYWLDNFSTLKKGKNQYIREAKVVFVGDGKVGKTSLKYLLLQNERIEAERTQEIEIHTDTEKFTYQSDPLTLHFWDFGGQEIMHATHKFFMTERSVYLLVVSGREEKEETLEKWLEMLRSTCGDSPILLVANQLDNPEDTHRLPLQRLLADYPQIRGVVETSWKTGRGIEALQTKIQEILETLPHFEEPFAPKYAKVKARLLDLNENYINYREYAKICAEVGQELEEDFNSGSQSVLADVLNYLGIMLNFRQKSDELEDLFIFNPKWIIRGVYKIINSEAVQKSGKISELEVNKLLRNTDYQTQQERDFIL